MTLHLAQVLAVESRRKSRKAPSVRSAVVDLSGVQWWIKKGWDQANGYS